LEIDKKILILIDRDRRNYFFASVCSALTALLIFYKLFHNDFYLRLIEFHWYAAVVGALTLGNLIHGYFAFKSFDSIGKVTDIEGILKVKFSYYKSMIFYFFTPYFLTIVLFITMQEFQIAFLGSLLFALMISICYFFDLKPLLKHKK
jgi:hypothetical protein